MDQLVDRRRRPMLGEKIASRLTIIQLTNLFEYFYIHVFFPVSGDKILLVTIDKLYRLSSCTDILHCYISRAAEEQPVVQAAHR